MKSYQAHNHIGPFFHRQLRKLVGRMRMEIRAPLLPYKKYERFPSIQLPTPEEHQAKLTDTIQNRISSRDFDDSTALSLEDISTILFFSLGFKRDKDFKIINPLRKMAPSGGALYPIEGYVIIPRSGLLERGLYYYDAYNHSLVSLFSEEKDLWEKRLNEVLTYSWSEQSSMVLMLTSIWKRTYTKYSELGYSHALIEAGHIGQNALLCAEALKIQTCAIAGFRYEETVALLDEDDLQETPVHMIAFSKK